MVLNALAKVKSHFCPLEDDIAQGLLSCLSPYWPFQVILTFPVCLRTLNHHTIHLLIQQLRVKLLLSSRALWFTLATETIKTILADILEGVCYFSTYRRDHKQFLSCS